MRRCVVGKKHELFLARGDLLKVEEQLRARSTQLEELREKHEEALKMLKEAKELAESRVQMERCLASFVRAGAALLGPKLDATLGYADAELEPDPPPCDKCGVQSTKLRTSADRVSMLCPECFCKELVG